MSRKVAIIIAILMGGLAVFLTQVYFKQKEAAFQVEETRVVVAARDITKGSTIDHNMLTYKMMPTNFIQPGALKMRELAVGKTAVVTIMAGEQILANKLATPGKGLTLAGKTPPGKRAATIALDLTSTVGGMVRPGDHVDILASFSNPSVILTLFQDVLILAVGQEMIASAGEKGRQARPVSSRRETITLALSPQEVQILSVAMEYGKIRLTLRPQLEVGKALPTIDLTQLPPVVDLNTLLRLYIQSPQEVKAPSVEVIRGLKKEVTPLPR
jgi:pilus assembly protein CpaB